jgi:hypothetical protein
LDEPSSSGAALVAAPFVGPDQAAFEAMLNPLLHAIAA